MNRVYPPVRGATGRMVCDLAKEFAHKGWAVTVISSGNGKKTSDEVIDGARVVRVKGAERLSGTFPYMMVWLRMLVVALRFDRHDIVVSMSDPPLVIVAGWIVSKFKKSCHINWCQDLYPDVLPALGIKFPEILMRLFKASRVKAMKKCDKIITCGKYMAEKIIDDGIDESRVSVVSNWPDNELTETKASNFNCASSKQGELDSVRPFDKQIKTKKRFRVLYSGNIGLANSIDTILEAAILLDEQDSDIEFVFVGDGARFDYIAEKRSLMALDNIRLLPYQPSSHIREMMESGDVHLITMNDAALGCLVPCKIYSAMAVARPCIFIGPKKSEIADIISDYGSGLVIAQGDAKNLVNALLHFRNSSEAWFEAHNGAIKARKAFIPSASIGKWIGYADQVIKQSDIRDAPSILPLSGEVGDVV